MGYVHQIITTPGDHCLEIVFPGGKSSPFWKSDGWKYGPPVRPEWKTGPCDQKKYNERDSQVKDYDGWTKDKNGGLGSVLQNKYGFGKKATETNAVSLVDATPYCLFHEHTVDHKCMEACAAGKFATRVITNVGHCPTKYSTVDHTVTQEQCPDGVTNLRYCQSTKLNVTVTTKGEAGGFAAKATETNAVSLADATPYCLFHEDTVDHKCMEACAAGKFATKGITNVGHCPTKYSTVDHTVTQEQCPDGVTNLRYCQSTKLNVTVTTKGEAGGFAAKATETNAVS